jgi:hypothetical protein
MFQLFYRWDNWVQGQGTTCSDFIFISSGMRTTLMVLWVSPGSRKDCKTSSSTEFCSLAADQSSSKSRKHGSLRHNHRNLSKVSSFHFSTKRGDPRWESISLLWGSSYINREIFRNITTRNRQNARFHPGVSNRHLSCHVTHCDTWCGRLEEDTHAIAGFVARNLHTMGVDA